MANIVPANPNTFKMNNEYWQEEIETMPRPQLQQLQLERLKRTINISAQSPFYKKRFAEYGITADSIKHVEDIRKIPFTTKQDLRDNYPFGLVGGNMKDTIRIHSSSGTTGHPTVIAYSRHDIDSWANLIAIPPNQPIGKINASIFIITYYRKLELFSIKIKFV